LDFIFTHYTGLQYHLSRFLLSFLYPSLPFLDVREMEGAGRRFLFHDGTAKISRRAAVKEENAS